MRILEVGSSDPSFRTVKLHAGLNILLADKTRDVGRGDTRNGTGKSSFLRIVRFMLGGNKEKELQLPVLRDISFYMRMLLSNGDGMDEVTVTRLVTSSKVNISGWRVAEGEISNTEWCDFLQTYEFHIPEGATRPTLSQLRAQFFRTHFDPTKLYSGESGWESGARIGFLLGLDPQVLSKSGVVARLRQQQKAFRAASKDGALDRFDLDVPGLEGRLAAARSRRDKAAAQLQGFTIDERYREHQNEANTLSLQIRGLNDQALALDRRLKEIQDTLLAELGGSNGQRDDGSIRRLYEEAGLLLPNAVAVRYEQVRDFHRSVLQNRRLHLEAERDQAARELTSVESLRAELDRERASVLALLQESVALDTFMAAERSLGQLESAVADLERQLEFARNLDSIGDEIKLATVEAKHSVTAELASHQQSVDEARAYFAELAQEVYGQAKENAKEAELRIGASSVSGSLDVEPRISGDASEGIRSVETFLLDIVLMRTSIRTNRNPRVLFHDSHLFDSVDSEQVADCLNIGARLSDELDFQYIVTMNSDDLRSAEAESDEGFDSSPYVLDTRLSDETDALRLYGRQLD